MTTTETDETKYNADFLEFWRSSGLPADERLLADKLLAWPGVSEASNEMTEEKMKVADKTGMYSDVANLYPPRLSEKKSDRFWHERLNAHAYPIGNTYGGDPIVQATTGKHAGKIFLTNHECWHGSFEHLLSGSEEGQRELEEEFEDAMEELELTSLASLTTDQLLDFMMHEGLDGNCLLANDFREFYRNLCRYRGAT